MRTIKYFGIGSLSASFILLFAGVYVLSAFFFFAFCVLSVVYAVNNRGNYKKNHSRKVRVHRRNYAATLWWWMDGGGDYSAS